MRPSLVPAILSNWKPPVGTENFSGSTNRIAPAHEGPLSAARPVNSIGSRYTAVRVATTRQYCVQHGEGTGRRGGFGRGISSWGSRRRTV